MHGRSDDCVGHSTLRREKRYLPWPRAGVHDIRHQRQAASSGSVGRRGESMWSRTVSPTSTEQGLPRGFRPVAGSIETGRGTPPKDVDSAAPQASVDRGEVDPARRPRQTARSFSRRQGLKQRDGRQAGHASDSR
ncbi:hypothetical protein TcG_11991 [Trypanosoma cruzi]|nr:hypothetical protein TcG_11991 [Trypanosoma cruzi]